MKRMLLLGLCALAMANAAGASEITHLMRFADLHGDMVVFTYEGDLWLADTGGGDARRITSHPGNEANAKFSPDGTQLAFTASYDGGNDVYVMDVRGGEPRRLTWHPAGDQVLDWHPDGERVLFRSNRVWPNREFETYLVSVHGGLPERLPLDRGGLASVSPDGSKVVYNRISREARTWKRYQGGMAQDVWLADLNDGSIVKLTDWPGSDNFPMWHGESVVFNSDREDGKLNLYLMNTDGSGVRRLTRHTDYDVKYPSMGDGGRVIYQNAAQLHVLDLGTRVSTPLDITIRSDRPRFREDFVEAAPQTGSFRLSPAGERVLLEARGEILNLPADEGDALDLTHASGSREKDAVWSPDGAWIAFISDRTGEQEIWLTDQKGGETKQLTRGGTGLLLPPVWSPDSKHLIFADKFLRLNLVTVDGGRKQVIAQSEYDDAWERWGIQDYVWSPCSHWIAYTSQGHNMNESIHLYSLDSGETTRLTDDWHNDWSPSFSTEGDYLFFLSNRTFEPIMGRQDQNHVFLDMTRPYLVLLRADAESPFAEHDVLVEAKEDDEGEDKKDVDSDVPTVIELDDIGDRVLACEGVTAGAYFRLEAVDGGFLYLKKNEYGFLKYETVNDGTTTPYELMQYVVADAEAASQMDGITNYHLSPDGTKLAYRSGTTVGVVDAGAPSSVGEGRVEVSAVSLRVDRKAEFLQIYDEAWRIQRDWFYDPGMHGVDWQGVRDKYRRFVPDCGTRGDLNYLIGEMISELNIGHTYIFGGDFADGGDRVRTGLLGCDLVAGGKQKYYRIADIMNGVSWDPGQRSPLAAPGSTAEEGDLLVAVDGVEVTTADNPYRHFQDKAGKWVTLTLNAMPGEKGAKTCRVRTIGFEGGIRYRDWVEGNREAVEKAGRGRIGYMHLPDMMTNGLIEFGKAFYPQCEKEALIIDERYNGGGFVGDQIIDRLERQIWALNQPREGKMGRNPERVFHGPIVVLINEDTGSNGEYFAYAIKAKKLATLIGMRTWGGAVGIEPHQDMVDGGGTTPPQFGPIGMDGTWIIEGHGVDPDIVIQNMPADVVAGKDAQLEKAVSHLLERLDKEGDSWRLPRRPNYPDKSR